MNSEAQGLQVGFCGGVQAPGLDLLLAQLRASLCMFPLERLGGLLCGRICKTLACPAMNVGTTSAEDQKHHNGRRLPQLVYGVGVQGPQRTFWDSPILRLSCKSRQK